MESARYDAYPAIAMGTWSPDVLGNDTSREVHEVFFERYDGGDAVDAIVALVRSRFETSLGLDEDRTNVELALALALWEVGALDPATLARTKEIAATGADLAAWRSLGADETQLRARSKALAKLVTKLDAPRTSPRRRKKPPVVLTTPFVAGACLRARDATLSRGGWVVIDSNLLARRGSLRIARTDLGGSIPPTFEDFERSHLVGFAWEHVEGQAARFASPNGKTGRIHTLGLGYETAAEGKLFLERFALLFEVVGAFPRFTQVLLATTGGPSVLGDEPARVFEKLEQRPGLAHWTDSEETLAELAPLLSTPAPRP